MENRRLRKEPARDETPVRLKGRDFEPLTVTPPPIKDNPPSAYDCEVPRPDPAPKRGGKRS